MTRKNYVDTPPLVRINAVIVKAKQSGFDVNDTYLLAKAREKQYLVRCNLSNLETSL